MNLYKIQLFPTYQKILNLLLKINYRPMKVLFQNKTSKKQLELLNSQKEIWTTFKLQDIQ